MHIYTCPSCSPGGAQQPLSILLTRLLNPTAIIPTPGSTPPSGQTLSTPFNASYLTNILTQDSLSQLRRRFIELMYSHLHCTYIPLFPFFFLPSKSCLYIPVECANCITPLTSISAHVKGEKVFSFVSFQYLSIFLPFETYI